ncbi:6-phosphogluconolactonase [Ascoidea rubescens DSM 1968]|uniref:6-phosphogluconolactonase-like protein n=1 Tax=Ascoidea rubescens DSM 1968 TaxID=1344418 RepID=A0A1D2VIF1_9ASCO|nr:YNR034Wp-like protein [Ascoidea rubescens DSM 1968]ODV61432.1 YNR034Wp-like protein [Ascoidea rubescens DSM 1968]
MSNSKPKIFTFQNFNNVADAVADHMVAVQNAILFSQKDSIKKNSRRSKSFSNIQQDSLDNPLASSIHNPASNPRYQEKRFKIAISGGSLIHILNKGLLKRNDVLWGKWDIYFADERLVPFDSPDSNFGLAKSLIFDEFDILSTYDFKKNGYPNVYHINQDLIDDPSECADDYEKILIKNFAYKDSVRLPTFDLFLLGCAADGHTASLFPFSESLKNFDEWVIPVTDAPIGPQNRVSLSIPIICHSIRLIFVVEGANKAPILKKIFESEDLDDTLPSSVIHKKAAGKVSWFVDNDALNDLQINKQQYQFQYPIPSSVSITSPL